MSLLFVLALLVGCTPQDADIQATYAMYFAADSSENLAILSREGTDVEASATQGKLGLTAIDCRDLSAMSSAEREAARLAGVDYAAECCEGASAGDEECTIQPGWFDWVNDYAYYLKEGPVDAWRTEAVLTTEGDLQLTVHMDVGEFGDFRFGWVVDPTFQPVECVDGEGGAVEQEVDGDWLTNWSANEEKGTLWHLNAGSFQINPSDYGAAWYLEQEWQAGYSFARFGQEEFYGHATDYSDPLYRPLYLNTYTGDCDDGGDNDGDCTGDSAGMENDGNPACSEADYAADPECEAGLSFEGPQAPASRGDYAGWLDNVDDYFNGSRDTSLNDLATLGKSAFPVVMKLEDNGWREVDDVSAGLDNWIGVSSSWVQIDNPEDIGVHPDKPITGSFQMYLEGVAAASKLFVGGTFSIENVRDDVWGYSPTLEDRKREENSTPVCGEERLTTDEPVE